MSVEAVHWALTRQTDEAVDKLVLIALANFAGEDHTSWPSRKTLAKAGMCSLDTVDRANRRLEARGLIRKTARTHQNGAKTSNVYELNVDGGWPQFAASQPRPEAATLAAPGSGDPGRIGCGHKEPSFEPSFESPDSASARDGISIEEGKVVIPPPVADDIKAEFPDVDLNEIAVLAAPDLVRFKRPSSADCYAVVRKHALLSTKGRRSRGATKSPKLTVAEVIRRQKNAECVG